MLGLPDAQTHLHTTNKYMRARTRALFSTQSVCLLTEHSFRSQQCLNGMSNEYQSESKSLKTCLWVSDDHFNLVAVPVILSKDSELINQFTIS